MESSLFELLNRDNSSDLQMAFLSSVFRRPSTIVSLAVRTLGPARSFDRGFAFNSFYKRFVFKGTQPSAAWRWQEVEGSDEFPFKRNSSKGDGRKPTKTRFRKEFNHGIIRVTVDGYVDDDVDVDYEDDVEEEDCGIPVKKKKQKILKNSTQYRIKFNDDEFIRVTVDDDLNEEEGDNEDEDFSDQEEEEEEKEEDSEEEEEDGDWHSFETKHIPKKYWTKMKKNLYYNESEHNPKKDWTELKLKELLNYLEDHQGFKLSWIKSRKPNLKKKKK